VSAAVLATIAVTGGSPAASSAGNVTDRGAADHRRDDAAGNAGRDEEDDVQEVHYRRGGSARVMAKLITT